MAPPSASSAAALALLAAGCLPSGAVEESHAPGVDAASSIAQADAASTAPLPSTDASPPPDAPPAPCVEGDARIESGGTCLAFFADPATWDTARAHCERIGADLAVLGDSTLNGLAASVAAGMTDDAWTGATDVLAEGQWLWVTGNPFSYQYWRDGEPNNAGNEDCMVIEIDRGGSWDDRPCGESHPFFCRRY